MNKAMILFRNTFVVLVVAAVTFSCSTDQEQQDDNAARAALKGTELQLLLETGQLSGAADTVLSQLYLNNGATGKSYATDECYTTEYSDSGYTVAFDNCTLNNKDKVSGVLSVVYSATGETMSYTATYRNFSVNDVKLNGTRSFLLGSQFNGNAFTFSVTSDMDMVLADGTIVSENGNRAFGFNIGGSLEDIGVTLKGSWDITVGSDNYKVAVTEALQTNVNCAYVSKGKMTVDKNGLVALVDFGDGACDDNATVTYPNGTIEEISLKD